MVYELTPAGTAVTDGPLPDEDARVTAPFEVILGLIGRSVSPDRAVADGLVQVTGDQGAFTQFPERFEGGGALSGPGAGAGKPGAKEE